MEQPKCFATGEYSTGSLICRSCLFNEECGRFLELRKDENKKDEIFRKKA